MPCLRIITTAALCTQLLVSVGVVVAVALAIITLLPVYILRRRFCACVCNLFTFVCAS